MIDRSVQKLTNIFIYTYILLYIQVGSGFHDMGVITIFITLDDPEKNKNITGPDISKFTM